MKYLSQDVAVRLWTRSNDVVSGVPSVSSIYTNTTVRLWTRSNDVVSGVPSVSSTYTNTASFFANKAVVVVVVVVVVALLSIVWSRI